MPPPCLSPSFKFILSFYLLLLDLFLVTKCLTIHNTETNYLDILIHRPFIDKSCEQNSWLSRTFWFTLSYLWSCECGQGRLSSVTGRSRERSAGVLLQAELRSGGGCTAAPGQDTPRTFSSTIVTTTKLRTWQLSNVITHFPYISKLVLDLNKQLTIR